jgi:hypothetical protein
MLKNAKIRGQDFGSGKYQSDTNSATDNNDVDLNTVTQLVEAL